MERPHYKTVRLRPQDLAALKEIFQDCFGPEGHLWVFGSRAKLEALGGDIDLYIEAKHMGVEEAFQHKSMFHRRLIDRIGDQRIDIVLNTGGPILRIYEMATTYGVQIL